MTKPSRGKKKHAPDFKHVWKDAFQSEYGPPAGMDRAVLFCLYANMDADGSNCFPSMRTLAKRLKRNKDTINAAITRLTESGWIRVQVLPGKSGKKHKYYPRIPKLASQWLGHRQKVRPSEQAGCPSGSDKVCPSGSDLLVYELVHVLGKSAAPLEGADSLSEEERVWLPTAEDHRLFDALTDEQKRRIAPSSEFPLEQISPLCLVTVDEDVKAELRREVEERKEQVA